MSFSQKMNQYVADLAWLVRGCYGLKGQKRDANMIESDVRLAQYWREDINKQLKVLERFPEPLIDSVESCKSHFLGRYFETLFSFAIEHLSTLTIIFEHLQINDAGKTLGEVDMLVRTPNGQFIQFEVAIKFYLERDDFYPNHWIGPNKNDSLRKKISRARTHQLEILKTEHGRKTLENRINGLSVSTNLLVFGRLYLALNSPLKIQRFTENNIFGGWIYVSDMALLMSFFSHITELHKPHWLSKINISFDFEEFTAQCVLDYHDIFREDDRPRHVVVWNESKGISSGRFVFVVPDHW